MPLPPPPSCPIVLPASPLCAVWGQCQRPRLTLGLECSRRVKPNSASITMTPRCSARTSKRCGTTFLGLTDEQIAKQHAKASVEANLSLDYFRGVIARIKLGLAPGFEGMWEDQCAYCSPWGFDLKSIAAPTQVWHGVADKSIPYQHAEWLAQNISLAELHLVEGESHVSLVANHWVEVQSWLATFS